MISCSSSNNQTIRPLCLARSNQPLQLFDDGAGLLTQPEIWLDECAANNSPLINNVIRRDGKHPGRCAVAPRQVHGTPVIVFPHFVRGGKDHNKRETDAVVEVGEDLDFIEIEVAYQRARKTPGVTGYGARLAFRSRMCRYGGCKAHSSAVQNVHHLPRKKPMTNEPLSSRSRAEINRPSD